jgi:hypothetical protein
LCPRQTGDQLLERFLDLRLFFFFGQRLQHFDQRQSCVEQRDQFLAKQHQREFRLVRETQLRQLLFGLGGNDGIAARLGLRDRLIDIGGVQRQQRQPFSPAQRFHLKLHRHSPSSPSGQSHHQLVMSAFSPSPPGRPSLP